MKAEDPLGGACCMRLAVLGLTFLVWFTFAGASLLAGSSTTLFNDAGQEVYGLRVVFDRPATITEMGYAFGMWSVGENNQTIVFSEGTVNVWGDFWFFWEPSDAQMESLEWLTERPAIPFDKSPFPSWGFTVPEIWGAGYRHSQVFQSLDGLIATGANSVTLAPVVVMTSGSSSNVATASERLDRQLDDMQEVIKYLRSASIEVSIKPKLLPRDGTWSAKIAPEDPMAWFDAYEGFLIGYAGLAEATGVKAVYLTNEVKSMVVNPQYESRWREIIASIRDVFSGEISLNVIINNDQAEATTNENLSQTKAMRIPFADALDFIGVSVYTPLTDKLDPTVAELRAAWYANREGFNLVEALREIHELYGKPVMISEIAYRWVDGTNMAPGWDGIEGRVDEQEQQDLFEAMLQVLSAEAGGWLRGVSVWGWFTYLYPESAYAGDFVRTCVQGKPAEGLLTEWFHRLGGEQPVTAD